MQKVISDILLAVNKQKIISSGAGAGANPKTDGCETQVVVVVIVYII